MVGILAIRDFDLAQCVRASKEVVGGTERLPGHGHIVVVIAEGDGASNTESDCHTRSTAEHNCEDESSPETRRAVKRMLYVCS